MQTPRPQEKSVLSTKQSVTRDAPHNAAARYSLILSHVISFY